MSLDRQKPLLLTGDSYTDERGSLQFVNQFSLEKVKRMYFTTNNSTEVIRAWQAHKIECRWFQCVLGSFIVKLVKVKNWENELAATKVFEYTLSADKPQILHIPSGYANGFKALEENSKLLILSDYALNEVEDNYKFNPQNFLKF